MHTSWEFELNTILPDDAISNRFVSTIAARKPEPTASGRFFRRLAAARPFAKLAAPDRDVVLATGDGYFMFGTPMPALWSAAHYKAPFLTLVFVNRSYTTGTNGLKRSYPNGVAVRTENYEGGVFDPPPDFAKLAEAANCFGTTVSEPDQVAPALKLALEQVRKGTPAWSPPTADAVEETAAQRGA
jgi:acetolactate synthase-1/2/3 large subunit